MKERFGEWILVVVLGALAASAAAVGAGAERVRVSSGEREAAPFVERAVYCPPQVDGPRVRQDLGISAETRVPGTVQIEPALRGRTGLPGDGLIVRPVEAPAATNVVGYSAPVAASSVMTTTKPTGIAAASCSPEASDLWFFAAGSSELSADQRLLLYNPFPDEAVVRVALFTPVGERSKANLADVAVPSGEWREVKINRFILREPVLSATVVAGRGRVVAWRAMLSTSDDRGRGFELSLGSTEASQTWYFPDGSIGDSAAEHLTVLNPTGQEAVVTVALSTSRKRIQPPELVDVTVPPNTSKDLDLATIDTGIKADDFGAAATLSSTNGVPVIAERRIVYTGASAGVAAEVGIRAAGMRWVMGPVAPRPDEDSVSVLNTGNRSATVSIELHLEGGEVTAPGKLAEVTLKAGLRKEFALERVTRGRPASVVVTSDRPVVAERSSYSKARRDVSDVMGTAVATPSGR